MSGSKLPTNSLAHTLARYSLSTKKHVRYTIGNGATVFDNRADDLPR
jgi:hypothetical protein